MRVALIVALMFQVLVAQAGVLGMGAGHEHGLASHGTTSSTHPHARNGAQETVNTPSDSADDSDGSQSHERCCCAFMGHCSSSAVATQAPDGMPFSPTAHRTARLSAFAARGFNKPPYRPPSFV
jgi:hypothetical protein